MNPVTIRLDATVDPFLIGAKTGLLWSGRRKVLAGIGKHSTITVERPDGAEAAQAALADVASGSAAEVVAFGAFPFDMDAPGSLVIPEIVVGVDADGDAWLTALDGDAETALRRVLELAAMELSPLLSGSLAPDSERDSWRNVVATAVKNIDRGALDKVVLAREVTVNADNPFAIDALLVALRDRFADTNIFAVDGFVGASPELLVERYGSAVAAHPLAGTARRLAERDDQVSADLLSSTKNQWEHRITIDWLLDTLLPFCSYVDAEPEPTIVALPNVMHLGTRVEGMLSKPPASILELVASLHPTPAVGGAPQAEAIATIAALEPGDRGLYAGPVGWVDGDGNGAFAVAIRSATITGAQASVWAGVGVVKDSDPQAELEETDAKFAAMLSVLTDQVTPR